MPIFIKIHYVNFSFNFDTNFSNNLYLQRPQSVRLARFRGSINMMVAGCDTLNSKRTRGGSAWWKRRAKIPRHVFHMLLAPVVSASCIYRTAPFVSNLINVISWEEARVAVHPLKGRWHRRGGYFTTYTYARLNQFHRFEEPRWILLFDNLTRTPR